VFTEAAFKEAKRLAQVIEEEIACFIEIEGGGSKVVVLPCLRVSGKIDRLKNEGFIFSNS
jgi:hypothetical protein